MGIGKGDLACMVSMHEGYGSKLSFSDTFKKAARQTSFIKAVPNGAVKRCA
uniref:Uncharacterized protein n=1 Tax=Vitis vinifera TaxID=29760 RepID=F6HT29_VITVI